MATSSLRLVSKSNNGGHIGIICLGNTFNEIREHIIYAMQDYTVHDIRGWSGVWIQAWYEYTNEWIDVRNAWALAKWAVRVRDLHRTVAPA